MYRFIIGGSGSGKTYRAFSDCISSGIRDGDSRFLLIVPEQATTETEKEIVKMHPRHATDNIDVLSFQRLAYRVFEELGIENPKVLDDISKAMLLRRIASAHEDELLAWKGRFGKPGFIDNLKSMVSEMYQYGLGEIPAEEGYPRRLKAKLHDLNLIFREFRAYTQDRFLTPEEIPDILARNIYRSGLIRNATIILDGFTGFTPVQYRIIENFLCYAKEVVITVSMGNDREHELFAMGRTVCRKITDLAAKNGVNHGQDIELTTTGFLEQHLLRYDKVQPQEGDGNISLIYAKNPAEEIQYVSGDIERRVKLGEKLRYRDIAVITTDGETYQEMLEHAFRLAQIPYYSDQTISLADNVFTQFVLAALDVLRTDYSYDAFVRYLKTGLVSDDQRMICLCDNYMYQYGRRGLRRMQEDWTLADDFDPQLNAFKNEIIAGLESLRAEDKAAAVRALCESLGIQEKLEKMRQHFAETGDAVHEREYAMAYDSILQVMDCIQELTGEEKPTALEYGQMLAAGIAQKKLGMIPSGVDRVTVGDLTRTRLEHIKVLYVLGANEGKIPKLLNRNSVITDHEKQLLKEAGVELSPTVKEDLYMQRYYLYRVLTKPTEHLTVTFAGADSAGAAQQESYIIPHLKSLFRNLQVHGVGEVPAIGRAREAYQYARMIDRAENYRYVPQPLGAASAESIYGEELYTSITRLEKYSECPYSYFLQYGLGLQEVQKYSFAAVDIGNLAHAALEKVFVAARKAGRDLTELSENERDSMVQEAIRQAVLDDRSAKYRDTSRNSYMVRRLDRIVKRSLWGITKMLQEDDFVPYTFEWNFDSVQLQLDNGKKMTLNGKVDRIDLRAEKSAEAGNRIGIRIVDYKTGSKEWDWNELLNSHDLQLALYMDAAQHLIAERFAGQAEQVIPQEMYYYHVQDPMILTDENEPDQEKIEAKILAALKPSGLTDPRQIQISMQMARENAAGIGRRIFDGDIAIRPRRKEKGSSCNYCPYRAVCGFDRRIRGFEYKRDHKMTSEQITEILNGGMDQRTTESD